MSVAISEPLYLQVKRLMMEQITSNKWHTNERLPNEFSLAKTFDVSQGTMRKALNELTAEGFLTRVQGVGTFITELNNEKSLYHYFRVELNETTAAIAAEPIAELLHSEILTADTALAEKLQCELHDKFIYMERSRSLNGLPVMYEEIYLPAALFQRLENESVENALGTSYLYRKYQSQFAVFIDKAKDQVYPTYVCEKLKPYFPDTELLLRVERIAYTQKGDIAERRTTWIDANQAHYYANLSR